MAFDQDAFYLGFAYGFSPLVRHDAVTKNIKVGTEYADVRAITFFRGVTAGISGRVLAWGRLERTPDVNQIYLVDRDTLSFTNTTGNLSISTAPLKPVFLYTGGVAPAPTETWRHFAAVAGSFNTINVTEYDTTGIKINTITLTYGTGGPPPPTITVTATTRMHYYHGYKDYVYYLASTNSIYVKFPQPMNGIAYNFVVPSISPGTVDEDFLGITRDGLLWMYDRGTSEWKGYFFDDCGQEPVINAPQPIASGVDCRDSVNPYENDKLSFPYMTCDGASSTYEFSPYTYYTDKTTKDCSVDKYLTVYREWSVNNWSNTTIHQYYQNISVHMLSPSFYPPSATTDQTQTKTLTCKDSLAPVLYPGGIGNLAKTFTFPCNDGPMQYKDNITSTCPYNLDIQRSWYYEDFCSGTVSYPQLILVRDTTSPNITIDPSTVNWNETDPIYSGFPTYSDNCSPITGIIVSWTNITINDGKFCTENELITRTWTATDECGLNSQVDQNITVLPPRRVIPGDQFQECPYNTHPNNTGYAYSWDPTYTVTWADEVYEPTECTAQGSYIIQVITRTWTVTDSKCGVRNGTQIITLTDSTPPEFFVPSDVIIGCDKIPNEIPLPASLLLQNATATDSCVGAGVNITVVDVRVDKDKVLPVCSSGVLNARTTVRTWTVVDTCGNTVSKDQKITFVDEDAPAWVKPPKNDTKEIILTKSAIADCKPSSISDKVGFPNANITYKNYADNCDPKPTIVYEQNISPSCDKVTYSWTMKDWCSNVYNYSFSIDIKEEQKNNAPSTHKSLSALIFMILFVLYFINQIE